MTPFEHYKESERLIEIAKEAEKTGFWDRSRFALQYAQVHATLATVGNDVSDLAKASKDVRASFDSYQKRNVDVVDWQDWEDDRDFSGGNNK